MLRFLATLGALYAAYRFGKETGRAEVDYTLLPPVDYERNPPARSEVYPT